MYYNMSRHAFGDLQGKLFPKYFLCGSVLSVSALASYCLMNPVELWQTKGSELYQVSQITLLGILFCVPYSKARFKS